MTVQTATDWARYVGLPWEENGRTPEGLDCWGLYRWIIGMELGVWLPEKSTHYQSTSDMEDLESAINAEREQWIEVDSDDVRPFDLVNLRMMGHPVHIGIVVGHWFMIHIEDGEQSVYEAFNNLKWHHRVIGFYRHECFASIAAARIGH